MNKKHWIRAAAVAAGISIVVSVVAIYFYTQLIQTSPSPVVPTPIAKHTFKVKEIYPTVPGGREWFVDMANPQADKLFDPDSQIYKEADGS